MIDSVSASDAVSFANVPCYAAVASFGSDSRRFDIAVAFDKAPSFFAVAAAVAAEYTDCYSFVEVLAVLVLEEVADSARVAHEGLAGRADQAMGNFAVWQLTGTANSQDTRVRPRLSDRFHR